MGPAALWFTEATANNIAQIPTAGVVTEYPVPTSASGLAGIALGPNNQIWFTEHTANKIGIDSGI
jgi:virginiamycin B lyase